MNELRRFFSIYSLIGLMIFGFAARVDAQGARREKESRRAVQGLNAKIEDFRVRLADEANRNSSNNQDTENLEASLQTVGARLDEFQTKLDRRRENAADVSEVLYAAKDADDAVNGSRLSGRTKSDWTDIRALFDRLANNYNVNWRWEKAADDSNYPNNTSGSRYPNDNRYPGGDHSSGNFPAPSSGSFKYALTGTYRLDASRSEDTAEIADRAVDNSSAPGNADARRDLREKLEAPEQIAVDVRGNQISLASSRAAAITFVADGRDRTEQTAGKTLRVRSTLRGQELTVSSLGGENDYTVVFASIDDGRAMRVTRRITTDYLDQTVFADSVYVKTDAAARLDLSGNPNGAVAADNSNGDANGDSSSSDSSDGGRNNYPNNSSGNSNNYPPPVSGRTGNFTVPNGTILTGTLQNEISTAASQNNDRFRLNVTAPGQYRGAVIEGRISGLNRSGKVSGNSQITFNFETIRLSSGQIYDFAGFLQSVTDANGNTVKVDAEGTARGNSRTRETVKRGGIGAGIGAIIGAIAGGGQGAAIGAVIGGGAGAGSVIVQGKTDLELKAGSSLTVQSSSPIR